MQIHKALLAYNIIGSYAEKRAREGSNLEVVYFQDYTHMLLRSALIPKNVRKAREFLAFILGSKGQNFIEKRKEGIHHLALHVDSIEKEIKRLEALGFEFISKKAKKGADNKRIVFLHPKSTNGVLVELCEDIKDVL